MPKYVIHIGPPKAGSKYLQSCLASLRKRLGNIKILYPGTLMTPQQRANSRGARPAAARRRPEPGAGAGVRRDERLRQPPRGAFLGGRLFAAGAGDRLPAQPDRAGQRSRGGVLPAAVLRAPALAVEAGNQGRPHGHAAGSRGAGHASPARGGGIQRNSRAGTAGPRRSGATACTSSRSTTCASTRSTCSTISRTRSWTGRAPRGRSGRRSTNPPTPSTPR